MSLTIQHALCISWFSSMVQLNCFTFRDTLSGQKSGYVEKHKVSQYGRDEAYASLGTSIYEAPTHGWQNTKLEYWTLFPLSLTLCCCIVLMRGYFQLLGSGQVPNCKDWGTMTLFPPKFPWSEIWDYGFMSFAWKHDDVVIS